MDQNTEETRETHNLYIESKECNEAIIQSCKNLLKALLSLWRFNKRRVFSRIFFEKPIMHDFMCNFYSA